MAVIEIKGVRIGEGQTKTIVPLMDAVESDLYQTAARAVAAGADCVEWRADHFKGALDADRLAEACLQLQEQLPETPLIFTLRTKGQGGEVELDNDAYGDLLAAVIEDGEPDLVDIELTQGDDSVVQLVDLAHDHGIHAIVSSHDFEGTPSVEEMEEQLVHMAELGADLPKLAVMARQPADPRNLMQATAHARDRLRIPLLTMSMGLAGQHTRLSGEVFGSALSFCALDQPSAPGQIKLEEALVTLKALHRQLAQ